MKNVKIARHVISPGNIDFQRRDIMQPVRDSGMIYSDAASNSSSLCTSYKSDADEQRDQLRVREIRKITGSTKRSKTSPSSFKDPQMSPEKMEAVLQVLMSGKQYDPAQHSEQFSAQLPLFDPISESVDDGDENGEHHHKRTEDLRVVRIQSVQAQKAESDLLSTKVEHQVSNKPSGPPSIEVQPSPHTNLS